MRTLIASSALCGLLALCGAATARADQVMYMGNVNFTSDLQPDQNIVLPSFDNMGGTLTLTGVQVDLIHSGSVTARGDNDDPFQGVQANARIIRSWDATGPGVAGSGFRQQTTPFVDLAPDNGDLGLFDPTAPDGVDFGGLAYTNLPAGTFFPAPALYSTNGPGNVNFLIDVTLMTNDNQFQPAPPDAWQLEVENPLLNVKVAVTYTFTPEPTALALLAVAGLLGIRRR